MVIAASAIPVSAKLCFVYCGRSSGVPDLRFSRSLDLRHLIEESACNGHGFIYGELASLLSERDFS